MQQIHNSLVNVYNYQLRLRQNALDNLSKKGIDVTKLKYNFNITYINDLVTEREKLYTNIVYIDNLLKLKYGIDTEKLNIYNDNLLKNTNICYYSIGWKDLHIRYPGRTLLELKESLNKYFH